MNEPVEQESALAPVERCRVGIVAERRRGQGPWSGWLWLPIGAIAGGADLAPGAVLRDDGDRRQVFIGSGEVMLVRSETEAYKINLESGAPSIYVVATALDDNERGLALRCLTVSPWEAEAFLDGAHVVERIAMPPAVEQLARDFVAAFHVAQVFMKRQRTRHDPRRGFGRGSQSNDYGPGTFEPSG